MGQNFLPDTVDQTLLFPPSLHDWLPENHLARFVVDVVSELDLSAIYKSYQEKDGRGQAAYSPEMMVRLLLYGYANGVYRSEEHTSELQSLRHLVCRLLLEKKKNISRNVLQTITDHATQVSVLAATVT